MNSKTENTRENESKYILLIIVAICFLATGGIFVKYSKLPPINTGMYRVLFSIPMLFPFVFRKLKGINRKDVAIMFIAGMFLAGDLSLWNISFGLTSVANANLLANFTPFTVIPVSYFLFKEKIPSKFLFGAVLTLIGVVLLVVGKINPSMANFKGDIMAFSTSIFYSGFLLTVYKLRDKIDSMVIMFVSAFGSLTVLLVVISLTEKIQVPTHVSDLYPLIGLALASQILGQGLLAFCLGKVNATLSSVICLAQPVIAAIYAFILFNEKLAPVEILGVVVCIIGVYVTKKNYD